MNLANILKIDNIYIENEAITSLPDITSTSTDALGNLRDEKLLELEKEVDNTENLDQNSNILFEFDNEVKEDIDFSEYFSK